MDDKVGATVISPPLPLTGGWPPCTLPYKGNANTTRRKDVVRLHNSRSRGWNAF